MRNQKGFSLVELLIVVAIVGILSAIAIPTLISSKKRAAEASAIQMLRTVGSAQAAFMSNTGRAGTLAELIASRGLDATMTDASNHNNFSLRTVNVSLTSTEFEFAAEPVGGSNLNGDRSFNILGDFVIRYQSGQVAPSGTAGTVIGTTP